MNSYVLSAIILSALITFLLRAFPFLLFKEKELPKWLEKLEKNFPKNDPIFPKTYKIPKNI